MSQHDFIKVSLCHFNYLLIKKLRGKWLRLLRDGCESVCVPSSRDCANQNLLSKWRGGNLLFWVHKWWIYWAGGRQRGCNRLTIKDKSSVISRYKKVNCITECRDWSSAQESPSVLFGTGTAPSEAPDLVWGPVYQERCGPLGESPEDTGEHDRRSRSNACKERFRRKNWRKRRSVALNMVPRTPPRGG